MQVGKHQLRENLAHSAVSLWQLEMLGHGINMPSFAPGAQEGDLVADPQIPNLPARSPPMTGGVGKSHGTHGSSKMIRGHVDGLKAQLQGGRGRKAEIGTATGGPSSNSSPSLGLMAPTTSLSGAKIGVGRARTIIFMASAPPVAVQSMKLPLARRRFDQHWTGAHDMVATATN